MRTSIRSGLLTSLMAAATFAGAGEAPACIETMFERACPAGASDAVPVRVCQKAYAYRAAEATAVFDDLAQMTRDCLGDAAERPADASVNHPDSYKLRQFLTGDVVISISLKDKAALDQTFVFLRVEPQPPE